MEFAKKACLYAIQQGCAPVAVHLLYPQILNDADYKQREIGTELGMKVLKVCDELWICGNNISNGMKAEIILADKLKIPKLYIPEQIILDNYVFNENLILTDDLTYKL